MVITSNGHAKGVVAKKAIVNPELGSGRIQLIQAPKLQDAVFEIRGTAPLVIHRFSVKTKREIDEKNNAGKSSSSKKKREPINPDDVFNEARYVSQDGWDGFNASAIRAGMIDACRLISFKMTLAKMSVFVVQDGWDAQEPQIPLIRIYGKAVRQDDMCRVATGQPYIAHRPVYNPWSAKVHIRWDSDQFSVKDVAALLMRVGAQVGIGEGRPFSKNSGGMGWGTFEIVGDGK